MVQTLEELSQRSRRHFAIKIVTVLRAHPAETGRTGIDIVRAEARWQMLSAIGDGDTLRSILAGTQNIPSETSPPDPQALKKATDQTDTENAEVRALLARNLLDKFEDYFREDRAVVVAEWLLLIDQYCGDYGRLKALGMLLRGIGRYLNGDSKAKVDILEAAQIARDTDASAPLRVATLSMVARCESDDGKTQASAATAAIEEASQAAAGNQILVELVLELRNWMSRRSELLAMMGSNQSKGRAIAHDEISGVTGFDLYRPLWSNAIGACVNGRADESLALCQTMDALARSLQCESNYVRTMGLVAVHKSSWAIGEVLLRVARQNNGNDDEIVVMLARALRHQGKTDEASELLTDATAQFSANSDVWRDLGLCLLDVDDTRGAWRALAKAVEINPNDAIAGMALSSLKPEPEPMGFDPQSGTLQISPDLLNEEPEQAAAAITAAIIKSLPGELEEKIAEYTAGQRPEFALLVRAALGAPSAVSREEGSLDRATRLFQARKFDEAKDAYAEAIAGQPDDAYAHMAIGDCHYMMGEFHLAAAYFEESIAIEPARSTWRFLGDAYRKVGRFEKARAAYESALVLDPTYHIARQQLDAMNAELGDDR